MTNQNLPKIYYSIEEVMELLGVGKNKVYNMLYQGTIPKDRQEVSHPC